MLGATWRFARLLCGWCVSDCVGRWHSLVVGWLVLFRRSLADRSSVGCVRWLSLVVDGVLVLQFGW